ncbi:MAG: PEP-CTERM sorting domain-containing protein [Planctomycetes bacterium]|nr:PEP-CTERM sorting domain-containing protein [Planctomycetota bacterium]
MWAISEADYDIITADGTISPAELDANNYLRAVDSTAGFAPQKISPGNSMRWVNGVMFSVDEFGAPYYGTSIFDYDELRYGDSLVDVVLLIPEPSSLILAGLAVLLCVGGSRKKVCLVD